MNGQVDSFGRALVTVSVRASDAAASHDVEVWVDTGFNGDLVLQQQRIDDLGLAESGTISRPDKSFIGLVKDLFDPGVNLAWLNTKLVSEIRDRLFPADMPPNDLSFLLGRKVSTCSGHGMILRKR